VDDLASLVGGQLASSSARSASEGRAKGNSRRERSASSCSNSTTAKAAKNDGDTGLASSAGEDVAHRVDNTILIDPGLNFNTRVFLNDLRLSKFLISGNVVVSVDGDIIIRAGNFDFNFVSDLRHLVILNVKADHWLVLTHRAAAGSFAGTARLNVNAVAARLARVEVSLTVAAANRHGHLRAKVAARNGLKALSLTLTLASREEAELVSSAASDVSAALAGRRLGSIALTSTGVFDRRVVKSSLALVAI